MNPAKSMNGMTHQVSIAPPVNITSVIFMAASIAIIEIRDMPIATLNASFKTICLESMYVSSMIDVIRPFMIAKLMIRRTENSQGFPVT